MATLKSFAATATYDCGVYSGSAYSQNDCGATSGSLADTGFNVLLPVFLAISLIGASVILVIKRLIRRRRQATASAAQ